MWLWRLSWLWFKHAWLQLMLRLLLKSKSESALPFTHMSNFSLHNILIVLTAAQFDSFFSIAFSQTRSSWPLLSLLPRQPVLPPGLQRSPYCLQQSYFSQQTGSASSHITGASVQFKRDQWQPGQLRRNQRAPWLWDPGRRSRQHVGTGWHRRCRLFIHLEFWSYDLIFRAEILFVDNICNNKRHKYVEGLLLVFFLCCLQATNWNALSSR